MVISSLDNFLPDSVDKNSGTLSVAQSGEVNLNYAGNRDFKVNDPKIGFSFSKKSLTLASLARSCLWGLSRSFSNAQCAKINGFHSGHPDYFKSFFVLEV